MQGFRFHVRLFGAYAAIWQWPDSKKMKTPKVSPPIVHRPVVGTETYSKFKHCFEGCN